MDNFVHWGPKTRTLGAKTRTLGAVYSS